MGVSVSAFNQYVAEDQNRGAAGSGAGGGSAAGGASGAASGGSSSGGGNSFITKIKEAAAATTSSVDPAKQSNPVSSIGATVSASLLGAGTGNKASLSSVGKFIESSISKGVSSLMAGASDTFSFLQQVGGSFLKNLGDKLLGALISNIHIPEMVFLAGLVPLEKIKSNPSYKNNYLRKLALKRDLAMVLEWVDGIIGTKYSNMNGTGAGEAASSAMKGCPKCARYIMRKLYKEENELARIRVKPTVDDPIGFPASKKEAERIDKILLNARKNQHKIAKAIILGSYSNLVVSYPNSLDLLSTTVGLKEIIKEFKIHPSAFGDNDKEFGKSFKISKGDITTAVPFYKPKKPQNKLRKKEDKKTGKVTYFLDNKEITEAEYKYKEAQNKSSGSLAKDMSDIPGTRLAPTPMPEVKFISPKNFNIKKLYVYLSSKSEHGEFYMNNKAFYERMKYMIYSTLVSAMDQAAAGLFNTGLGKMFTDTLKNVESAIYDYTKSVENYLYDPSKVQYLSMNDFTSIPEPDELPPKPTPAKPGTVPPVPVTTLHFNPEGSSNPLQIQPGQSTNFEVLLGPTDTTQKRVVFEVKALDMDYYKGKLNLIEKKLQDPIVVSRTFNGVTGSFLKISDVYVTATIAEITGNETMGIVGRSANNDEVNTFINVMVLKPVAVTPTSLSIDQSTMTLSLKDKIVGGLLINFEPINADVTINYALGNQLIAQCRWDSKNLLAINPKRAGDTDLTISLAGTSLSQVCHITIPDEAVAPPPTIPDDDNTPSNGDYDIDDPRLLAEVETELVKGLILPTWELLYDPSE